MAVPGKRFILTNLDDPITYKQLIFAPYKNDGSYLIHNPKWSIVDYPILGAANPTSYEPNNREEPIKSKISINGYRIAVRFPLAPESKKISWDRIGQPFYEELKKRCDSGHRYLLRDQDGKTLVGRIKEFQFSAIVATVPTLFTGSFVLEGIGNWESPL
ncbi:MAG: hypothetical protein WC476_01190 [Phycisphaerae bacterium]|jgi:hypothetical protein